MSVDFLLQEDSTSLFLLENGLGDILLESSTPNSTVFRSFTQVGRPGVRMVRPANMAAIISSTVATPQTSPIPGVSQPEQAWWNRTDINRAQIWIGPDQQFEGATRQQTYIFPLSQPEPARIIPFINYERYIVDAPKRFDGATQQQTYIFPQGQPDPAQVTAFLNRNRYLVDAQKRFDGATVQDWFIYPLQQPEARRWNLPDPNRYPRFGPFPQFEGATTQPTFVFQPNQPELSRFSETQRNRFIVDVTKRLENAVVAATGQMFFRSFTQVGRPGYRMVQMPKSAALDNVTQSQPTFPIPPVSQPELSRYSEAQRNRFIVDAFRQLSGATDQQTYVFEPSQPDQGWFAAPQRLRFVVEEPKYYDGAVTPPPVVSVFYDKVFVGTIFGGWIDSIDTRAGGT